MELVHYTDCGPRPSNQDAYCARVAVSPQGTLAMAVVCDGMGGLQKGELASAQIVQAMQDWFDNNLPALLERPLEKSAVRTQWEQLLQREHRLLAAYGGRHGLTLGTTVSAMFMTPRWYLLMQVGDSRIYLDTEQGLRQLTWDQNLAAREYIAGQISGEQFRTDPRRSILLQCVGARKMEPAFFDGTLPEKGAFLLCSDGFYHLHSEETIRNALHGAKGRSELRRALAALAQAGRQGGETDNMTAVALRWDAAAPMPPATQPLGLEPEQTPVLDIQAKVCQIHTPHTAFES